MNKGDIKATITLLSCIIWGILCAIELEKTNPKKDGSGHVVGFILGIIFIPLIIMWWKLIRVFFED